MCNDILRNDIESLTQLDDILGWLEYDSDEASLEDVQQRCDWMFKKYHIRVTPNEEERI